MVEINSKDECVDAESQARLPSHCCNEFKQCEETLQNMLTEAGEWMSDPSSFMAMCDLSQDDFTQDADAALKVVDAAANRICKSAKCLKSLEEGGDPVSGNLQVLRDRCGAYKIDE